MSSKHIPGRVIADSIEVRFAFSGRVSSVAVKIGDRIRSGRLLARLDRTSLQTALDRELADYEKARAEFEIFVRRQGDPQTDLDRFEKTRIQSLLDVSVKAVELAKQRLDQTDLLSPVTGIVVDDGGNRPGLYITPASNAFTVLDTDSVRFRVELDPEQLPDKIPESVDFKVGDSRFGGHPGSPVFDGKKYFLDIFPDNLSDLKPGVSGQVSIS